MQPSAAAAQRRRHLPARAFGQSHEGVDGVRVHRARAEARLEREAWQDSLKARIESSESVHRC